MCRTLLLLALLLWSAPLLARDSLGVFGGWGAFRDPDVPRCYAIAAAVPSRAVREHEPFAAIGTWPGRKVRGQVNFRLARTIGTDSAITLSVGDTSFTLRGSGSDAWAQDPRADAAIVAAMRAAGAMWITARDRQGRRFTDRYDLEGAATAMDAATVGCARS